MAMIESNDYGGPISFFNFLQLSCESERISVPGMGMEEIKRLFLCAYSILPAGSSSTLVRVHLGLD